MGAEAYVSRAEDPLQPEAGGRRNTGLALLLPNMKPTSGLEKTLLAGEQLPQSRALVFSVQLVIES